MYYIIHDLWGGGGVRILENSTKTKISLGSYPTPGKILDPRMYNFCSPFCDVLQIMVYLPDMTKC